MIRMASIQRPSGLRFLNRTLILLSLLIYSPFAAANKDSKPPPVFQVAPVLESSLKTDRWCNTPGVDTLSSPLVRVGLYLFATALFLSRLFSPSSQGVITILACAVIIQLNVQILLNSQDSRQSVIGEHPIALEFFLVALPSWLCLLCTSPLRMLRQVTNFNIGLTLSSFLFQTIALLLLTGTQIFVATPKNRFLGMDMRTYEITRNRDSDMERVYDGSVVEMVYHGENLCGRRAVFASKVVLLDQHQWSNFLIAWAVFASIIWLVITILWILTLMQQFSFIHGLPFGSSDIYDAEANEGIPAISRLHPLFRDGELPPREPLISNAHRIQGIEHAEDGWGGWLRYKLNLQYVVLSKASRHFELYYGFANPVNISWVIMLSRLIGLILVVMSIEQTVNKWNILFGRRISGDIGKDGDFSNSTGDWGNVVESGMVVIILGIFSIIIAMWGLVGENWYWRVVQRLSEKVLLNRGIGRRHLGGRG